MLVLLRSAAGEALLGLRPLHCTLPGPRSASATSRGAMKVLNVAEKNDAAKNLASIMSGGQSRMVRDWVNGCPTGP